MPRLKHNAIKLRITIQSIKRFNCDHTNITLYIYIIIIINTIINNTQKQQHQIVSVLN